MKGLCSFGLAAALLCIPAAQLSAQGPGGPRNYGSSHGFGNILFPGTGNAPNLNVGLTVPIAPLGLNHGQRLAGTIQGRVYPSHVQGHVYPSHGGRGRTVVVPYAFPVAVGGWGYGGYGYGYPPQEPNVTIVQAAPPQNYLQQQPPVVINQYYSADAAKPVMKEYGPGASSSSQSSEPSGMGVFESSGPKFPDPADRKEAKAILAEDKPTIYLIAFKSGNIYPALGYWVEDETLHYVTKDKSLNQASLSLIDRELSAQLNEERRVEFKLPATK